MYKSISTIILLFCGLSLTAQDWNRTNCANHIEYLASDDLEGRETGKEGCRKAADYIAGEFKALGLTAAGTNGFFQAFEFVDGKQIGGGSHLDIGESSFEFGADLQALAMSGSGKIRGELVDCGYGISAKEIDYDDLANKTVPEGSILLVQLGAPEAWSPHSKYYPYAGIREKLNKLEKLKPSAVIFWGEDQGLELPSFDLSVDVTSLSIPVLYMLSHCYKGEPHFEKETADGHLFLEKIKLVTRNVAALIDNKSDKTVVIGAHYDHLGYGAHGSLHTGKPEIHNGADDNASGVALMLELAQHLSKRTDLESNYLFLAFSGEEKGLFGSNYYTKNSTVPVEEINYMLNFDMVGRLDTDKGLQVNGSGTSPAWGEVKQMMEKQDWEIHWSESGIGPSDHTSFYLLDIPVLHFFTGAHDDYHRPGDDAEKINYDGLLQIGQLVWDLLIELDDDALLFTKTKEEMNQSAPRFTVTLGVIPDYLFSDKGMRIDGVREGKTADVAGVKKGDIVIQLGEYEVVDMMSYMTALSKFSKGDATKLTVLRGSEEIKTEIVFQ